MLENGQLLESLFKFNEKILFFLNADPYALNCIF